MGIWVIDANQDANAADTSRPAILASQDVHANDMIGKFFGKEGRRSAEPRKENRLLKNTKQLSSVLRTATVTNTRFETPVNSASTTPDSSEDITPRKPKQDCPNWQSSKWRSNFLELLTAPGSEQITPARLLPGTG